MKILEPPMTDSEFIEDMKIYKLDHEPDGRPAVQQWKIDRLLDMSDRLEKKIASLETCIAEDLEIIKRLKGELILAEQDAAQLRNIGIENIINWHDKANRYNKIMEVINER